MPRPHPHLLLMIALFFASTTLNCGEGTSDDSNQEKRGPSTTPGGPIPDEDCAQLTPIRFWTSVPSTVVMAFTAEDCRTGEPLTELDEPAWSISEDRTPLSGSAAYRVIPNQGQQVYITLLLDMSAATFASRAELQEGMRRFVEEILVEQAFENVYISIDAFDGSQTLISLERPTRDAQKLLATIDGLTDFTGLDSGSTNLYGALNQSISNLQRRQSDARHYTFDELATRGHVLLFTASKDTAKYDNLHNVRERVEDARAFNINDNTHSNVRTVAIALDNENLDLQTLSQLVGGQQWILQTNLSELSDTFDQLGRQIAQQIQGTYLLVYCSSARNGNHIASVQLSDLNSNQLQYEFDAKSFEGGCTAELLDTACDADACSAFCGGCPEETHYCSGSGQCAHNCLRDFSTCGRHELTNDFGYTLSCSHTDWCDDRCVDLTVDEEACEL